MTIDNTNFPEFYLSNSNQRPPNEPYFEFVHRFLTVDRLLFDTNIFIVVEAVYKKNLGVK